MYKDSVINASVGAYRISKSNVWPAYINAALWSLFDMSKEEFIRSIRLSNIFGGRYRQSMDINTCLSDGKPLQSQNGIINTIGLAADNSPIQLKIIFTTVYINEDTSLLLFMIWKVTPEILNYNVVLDTLNLYCLAFNELGELGIEYDVKNQAVKLMTTHFTLESCWKIDTMELIDSFLRFLHPEDHACYRETILAAAATPSCGNISMRIRIMQEDYQPINLWYSSSTDEFGNVNRMRALIARSEKGENGGMGRKRRTIDRLFWDEQTLLHLEYDMDTNQRIRFINDLENTYFPCIDYPSTLTTIQDVFLYKADLPKFKQLRSRVSVMRERLKVHDYFYCDVRLLSCININEKDQDKVDYQWYHVIQELYYDLQSQRTSGMLSIYKIQENKLEGKEGMIREGEDSLCQVLDFNSFIIRYSGYFQTVQQKMGQTEYSALVLMKTEIKPEGLQCREHVMDQVFKTIFAFLQVDEFCGKYAENEYAILLHLRNRPDMIQERVRLLKIGLTSLDNADYSLATTIGYSILPDNEPNVGSQLLGRASIALFCAGLQYQDGPYQYSKVKEEDIRNVLDSSTENEKLAVPEELPGIKIRTFGAFDIFVENRAIPFTNDKAKELLAILVDRRGGFVTPSQAITYLWEDEACNANTLARLRKVALLLKRQLRQYGVEDIIESVHGRRRIVINSHLQCDYYDFFVNHSNEQLYTGPYMPEYSWAELTNAMLENKVLSRLESV